MAAFLAILCTLTAFGAPGASVTGSAPDLAPSAITKARKSRPSCAEATPAKKKKRKTKTTPAPSHSAAPAVAHRTHIRASEVRIPSLPRPTPKPHRVRGVKSRPKDVEPIVIAPKNAPSAIQGNSFVLSKSAPGKLVLQFHPATANFEFDPSEPFVIQLNPEGALKIDPSAFMRGDWPKNSQQAVLTYQGASTKTDNVILGKAAYIVCPRGNKKSCHREKTPIVFKFR